MYAPTAGISPQTGPPPVEVGFTEPARQRRLTVAFRLILAIPHAILLFFLEIGLFVVEIIGWFAAVAMGQLPQWAHGFVTGVCRYHLRLYAYVYLLSDRYPPFSLDPEDYPARMWVGRQKMNRFGIFFRIVLAVPVYIVSGVLAGGLPVVGFFAWLITLVAGRMPRSLHQALAATLRYQVRYYAYLGLLTPTYPMRLFGDPPLPGSSPSAPWTPLEIPEGLYRTPYSPPVTSPPYPAYPAPPTSPVPPWPSHPSPAQSWPITGQVPEGPYAPPPPPTPAPWTGSPAFGGPPADSPYPPAPVPPPDQYPPSPYQPTPPPPPGSYPFPGGAPAVPSPYGSTPSPAYPTPPPPPFAAAPYGTPPTGPPPLPPVVTPVSTRLVLTAAAKRLIVLIIILGVAVDVVNGVVRHNLSVTTGTTTQSASVNDADALGAAHDKLDASFNIYQTDTSSCAPEDLACLGPQATTLAGAFNDFSSVLTSLKLPASASSDGSLLESSSVDIQRSLGHMAAASDQDIYDSAASDLSTEIDSFNSSYDALQEDLYRGF